MTMAWLALTLKKLGTIGKIPRNLAGDNSVREAVKNFTEYVQAKSVAAKKQNDQVYHVHVPELETLEPIAGKYVFVVANSETNFSLFLSFI